ncbi:hypothetical protein LTR41_000844 [Exophiala xenobiotica]|nr:hypothetical protein LTR41_000844 [Exophiala xenobiotica]
MPQYLSNWYFSTLHQVYPILDPDLPFLTRPPRWADASPFEAFTLNMVYSIACHCLPGNNTQLTFLSETFYREALAHADKVTAELNLEALQGVVLLALRSLFDSQEGSLGQQVAFAHRLEVELSAKEMDETSSALDTLRSAIYCIGSQMATGLDRPSGLAEPSRFRNGLPFDELDAALVLAAHTAESTPLVTAAEKETAFLIRPNAEAALQLLATYDQEDMIFNVFTPHWAYKAGVFLLAESTDDSRLKGYMLASTVLERCALKWPNSRSLQETLRALASPSKHETSFTRSNGP